MPSAFQRILVPFDGSPAALRALRLALALAAPGATLHALFAVDLLVLAELDRFRPGHGAEHAAELEAQGEGCLRLAREEAAAAGRALATELVQGHPSDAILAAARRLGADLIALGHVGRQAEPRVLAGSVTERVLEYAPCPVLVVNQPK